MNRIIGAFLFRREVYAEVKKDTSFTTMAWVIVIVVTFLSQLGGNALTGSVTNWLIGTVVGTIFTLIGFAFAAFVVSWLGRALFKADTNFSEMVRCLGLAYVWNIVGVLGVLAFFSAALICIVGPIMIVAALLYLIAWLIAIKTALGLDWLRTIVVVIVGWIVGFVISLLAGTVLAMLGIGAATATGAIKP